MNYWTNELEGYVTRVLIFLSIIILYKHILRRSGDEAGKGRRAYNYISGI